jgi:hypothetical protein
MISGDNEVLTSTAEQLGTSVVPNMFIKMLSPIPSLSPRFSCFRPVFCGVRGKRHDVNDFRGLHGEKNYTYLFLISYLCYVQ